MTIQREQKKQELEVMKKYLARMQEAKQKRISGKKTSIFKKILEFVFGPSETIILSIEGPYVYYRGPAPTHKQIKEFKDRN